MRNTRRNNLFSHNVNSISVKNMCRFCADWRYDPKEYICQQKIFGEYFLLRPAFLQKIFLLYHTENDFFHGRNNAIPLPLPSGPDSRHDAGLNCRHRSADRFTTFRDAALFLFYTCIVFFCGTRN